MRSGQLEREGHVGQPVGAPASGRTIRQPGDHRGEHLLEPSDVLLEEGEDLGLVEALRALLADAIPDPFAPEVVAVPTRGMERALS